MRQLQASGVTVRSPSGTVHCKKKGPWRSEAFFVCSESRTSFEHLRALLAVIELIMYDENGLWICSGNKRSKTLHLFQNEVSIIAGYRREATSLDLDKM